MQFKIKQNSILFRDYDLTKYMSIKEIHIENNEAVVVAEFKANIDIKENAVLLGMFEEMQTSNLIDMLEHIQEELARRD